MHLAEPGSICSAWVHDPDEARDVLRADINVGDLLRTDIDPPNIRYTEIEEGVRDERLVLVVSLETAEGSGEAGYVTVLDCGIRTSISCVWLWPGDQSADLYFDGMDDPNLEGSSTAANKENT